MNYTPEITQQLIKEYQSNPSRDTIDKLAKQYSKSPRSIIGKLSKEGVYRSEQYLTKRGEKPITKKELVELLAIAWDIEYELLEGMEKTPKEVLKRIVSRFE